VLLARDCGGIAAIEFAVFAGLLSLAILNVTDVSIYAFQLMEVENATQMGAQAAWTTCGLTNLPATTNCSGLSQAVQNAVQSTSLGTKVALQSGSPAEGYYCINSSNALQYVDSVSNSEPSDCSAAGNSNVTPADYIEISTTFSYVPLFKGISIGGSLTTPIAKTAWMRLG
jgi:Flp pilus assembly protein TadG